jgi:hypothetical protein
VALARRLVALWHFSATVGCPRSSSDGSRLRPAAARKLEASGT